MLTLLQSTPMLNAAELYVEVESLTVGIVMQSPRVERIVQSLPETLTLVEECGPSTQVDNILYVPSEHIDDIEFLERTLVMPSRMCISPIHNKKGILHHSDNVSSEERWAASSCAMDYLYDMDFISDTVPVILDNSKLWHQSLLKSPAHKPNCKPSFMLFRFMECKDRKNRSAIMLPYSFLPSRAAKELRDAADKEKMLSETSQGRVLGRGLCCKGGRQEIKALLGDYDAIHVRRGDKIKNRKDRFGVERSLHPHLDRDIRPEYKLAYSSNYSRILDPLIENNYQLFIAERLIMMGAKTFIKTFKEDETSLSLTDDPKKNTKSWQIPVYTLDEEGR
ncbi:hypothetical protein FCV25MIE_14827 [Fagus crenata]